MCAFLSSPASARAETAEVLIRCAELSPEERARVEVRLLTELRTFPNPPGVLELTCEKDSVRGGWLKDGKLYDARNLSVAPGDNRTEMLLWISSLLLETEGDRSPESAMGASAAPAKPPTVGETLPAEPSPEPPVDSGPKSEPVVAPALATASSATRAEAERPASRNDDRTPIPLSVEAGLAYALYATEIAGALGPHVGGHFTILGPFGASILANVLFSTEQPASLDTLEGTLFLGADWAPLPFTQILFGPSLSWARVSGTNAARESLTFGVEASMKVFFPRPWGVFAQLGVRGLADERQVVVTDPDGTGSYSATFLPHWSPFLAIGGALDLSRL